MTRPPSEAKRKDRFEALSTEMVSLTNDFAVFSLDTLSFVISASRIIHAVFLAPEGRNEKSISMSRAEALVMAPTNQSFPFCLAMTAYSSTFAARTNVLSHVVGTADKKVMATAFFRYSVGESHR